MLLKFNAKIKYAKIEISQLATQSPPLSGPKPLWAPFSTISVHNPHFLAKLFRSSFSKHTLHFLHLVLVQIPLASTWSPEVQCTAQDQLNFYSFSQRNLSMSLVRYNLSSCLYSCHRIWIILAYTTDKGLAYFRISNVCVCDILRLWLAGSHLWHSFF